MASDVRDRLYIDGQWVAALGAATIDVVNATTEEVMGRVPDGTAADVDRAVQAARGAFAAVVGHRTARSGPSACAGSPKACRSG